MASSYSTVTKGLPPKHQILLDYVLAHVENDERPYLEVTILGTKFLGLLDSGATHTVLGGPGWEVIKQLGFPLNEHISSCTVANGERSTVLGSISIPFQLKDRFGIIDTLVVPSFPHSLILGADFWSKMGIVPNLRHGDWHFSDSAIHINELALQSSKHLTTEQSAVLNKLIETAFTEMGDKLGCTTLVEHEIVTMSPPIKQRYYPVSPYLQVQIDKQLENLLADDVIEKSTSPWSSPVVMVRKKDMSYRFCVDYRKLNKVTKRDAYPLPYISATLDKLRDAKFLSSMDIKSAYFQVPLSKESRPLTAFTIPNRGLFQFKRLPMGLANSPATFQRLIDRVLGPDLEPHVFVYLDDIIIVTQTFEKHIEVLREVFRRLKLANLTVAKEKCYFCRDELRYLGYVVDRNGLHVDPEKVSAILNIAPPSNVSEVRRFIGMTSWYRRFVPNYSTIIAPLAGLLRKNKRFLWDEACEQSFQALKEHLVKAPILSCPDFALPFTIQTDASAYGIGAVLTQQTPDGEKVISYLSRSLSRAERNYSTTERECLAVLYAIEKLRPYIEGIKFTVITDHYSLVWLNRLQSPSGRLARWSVRLQQYDFDIVHRKGKEHVVPDMLSRAVPIIDSVTPSYVATGDKWYDQLCSKVLESPRKFPAWRLMNGKLFKNVEPKYPDLAQDADLWREVVPRLRRKEIIGSIHQSVCHAGVYKTFHKLNLNYYWPKMQSDVARYVRRCQVCQATKPVQKRPAGLMLSSQTAISRPFELMCADLVGPLPRTTSGNQYILVVADCFSKFALLFPIKTAVASTIVRLIETQVFLVFGCPNAIIVDNGVQFRSKEFVGSMDQFGVKIKYTALYHPQANPCERINRVLKTMLRSYVSDNHRSWDRYLAQIGYAIRSTQHEVTKLTPNFVVFGREIPERGIGKQDHPIEFDRSAYIDGKRSNCLNKVFADVKNRLSEAYLRNKTNYDFRRRSEEFLPNQLVWRKNYVLSDASKYFSAKLAPKFVGPFLIAKRLSPWTYELKTSDGKPMGVWHAKDLKHDPPDSDEP